MTMNLLEFLLFPITDLKKVVGRWVRIILGEHLCSRRSTIGGFEEPSHSRKSTVSCKLVLISCPFSRRVVNCRRCRIELSQVVPEK